ncbi:unnamed protein product [Penicillium salamii]|uniref:BTB domain-containing protein n=1 Tax=Penicillium salamii TaxID=1612424 RepID=A0A9W4NP29_9EURO|nr:unnamed protein product [Penicillium salamii]CAG8051892.1 unnamed protein product [Penicillium salamii]CAG8165763.1 unnamed protein product [Penicillium salamii]CAG8176214.1 unnamed protein product [Penicillium salamii]CAG8206124.1 unnamed protein product [Penicillium salamii]
MVNTDKPYEPETSAEYFVSNILPLCNGPSVTLRLKPSNKEYVVSKTLLCAESPVFSAMFNGNFKESQQQEVTIEEMKDIVSVPNFQAFVQWLYQRTIQFDIEDPEKNISSAMELARLGDMYKIHRLEQDMAYYIRQILLSDLDPDEDEPPTWRFPGANTDCLNHDHIVSATLLPPGNPVRTLLVEACVDGFLRVPNHKFSKEIMEYPSFGVEILQVVGRLVHEPRDNDEMFYFADPISNILLRIGQDCRVTYEDGKPVE